MSLAFPRAKILRNKKFIKNVKKISRTGRKIISRIGKASISYGLINDGDRVLVGVSGGKDSLTLLTLLSEMRKWTPVKFDLFAVHIKTDFHCGQCVHNEVLTKIFEELEVPYIFLNIKVLDENNKTNCFWCSWNRRKAIFTLADEIGYNKIAFGHHKDDIVETILMNLLYNGEISTMNPKQELFEGRLTIIRPLCYVEEEMIKTFVKEHGLPEQFCKCPFGKDSRRKYIKNFLTETQKITKRANIKTNIFNSLSRIKEDYIDLRKYKEYRGKE
ncbi:2-thiocytidine tRNA biosynthesis protein, TtcA [Candidatus Omnitrophus magneticus]|uniref:2-thiocytidine tRNA biosynthesis protein, TtcA n=1 Tax=Candidatus Omnitrophus magneticus TaxID=1609969 RepID=A0A0F0CSK6_9BACT|nr:2-thiocytidine tRNA biosynthesis protein, TtcA [Candidatus Omnitrophus magneticus]